MSVCGYCRHEESFHDATGLCHSHEGRCQCKGWRSLTLADKMKDWMRDVVNRNEGVVRDEGFMGTTETGWVPDIVVDWETLDAEIDKFCEEFKRT